MIRTTRADRYIQAQRECVYKLLIDAQAIRQWKVPHGMSSTVHQFEARVGGAFRISLTYHSPNSAGKTSAHTDTYHGQFVTLVPFERIVETMEFETNDPLMRGHMTITYTLSQWGGGTHLVVVHEGIPAGVALSDNELGWRMALDKLKTLAENPSE